MLRKFLHRSVAIRVSGGLLFAISTSAVAVSNAAAVEGGVLHLRCTNPANGANWLLAVDLDRGTVDSLPATISDSWIKWRDTGGGIYELERATGKLQLRGASTTGGYFVHYTCQTE